MAQKRQDLSRRYREMQRDAKNIERALQRARAKSVAVVRQKMLDIVAKMVVERGANIALDKNFVIYNRVDQNLDITKEVLARLNTEIPDLTVEIAAE